jgi:hypothetical protein
VLADEEDAEMSLVEASRLLSFGLVVLIWLVQVIIYPAFADVSADRFARWHAGYTRAVTWIVAPLMLSQAALLSWLMVVRPSRPVVMATVAVGVAWFWTFAVAVPCHDRLQEDGLDRAVVTRLISANWVRTVAWTLAFVFLLLA